MRMRNETQSHKPDRLHIHFKRQMQSHLWAAEVAWENFNRIPALDKDFFVSSSSESFYKWIVFLPEQNILKLHYKKP